MIYNYLLRIIWLIVIIPKLCFPSTLTIGLPIEIVPKDPLNLSYLEEWEVSAALFDTLIKYDEKENIVKALANEWSYENRSILFTLRKNLKFSDGSPLTAVNVAETFKRILIFDKKQDKILHKCLLHKKKIRTINDKHPSIIIYDKHRIQFLIRKKCRKSFMTNIANPDYGVIGSQHARKIKYSNNIEVTSGPYAYKIGKSGMYLVKNNFHWSISRKRQKLLIDKIYFKKVESYKRIENIDILRTSDSMVLQELEKRKFNIFYSLPVMTWYLTIPKNSHVDGDIKNVFSDINNNLYRDKIEYFVKNLLERPTNNFFPRGFNCISKHKNSFSLSVKQRNRIKINIVEHPGGETKKQKDDIAKSLIKLGYKIDDDADIKLEIRRQFLGDQLLYLFELLFNTFQAIPDPSGYFSKMIVKYRSGIVTQSEICDKFYHYNHIPIAHRNYAFATRDKRYTHIFSKLTGNILYFKLNDILKGGQ